MTEEKTANKREDLKIKTKGSIFLQIGIVVMIVLLIWSVLGPKQERENQKNLLSLTRAKMKILFQLQYQYQSVDTNYTNNFKKLSMFAMTANEKTVPDSIFRPMLMLYKRFDQHKSNLENISLKDFKRSFMDSVIYNPLTGDKFIMEVVMNAGRKSFNIKPSTDEEVIKKIGAVLNGEITWNEKAELI
jgi:hypothetical protein